jgi:hypothetical protein
MAFWLQPSQVLGQTPLEIRAQPVYPRFRLRRSGRMLLLHRFEPLTETACVAVHGNSRFGGYSMEGIS